MSTESDLATYFSLTQRAKALADRWVKVCKNGDFASNVRVDPERKLILFSPAYRDGGMWINTDNGISTRYLEDDSALERDAITWSEMESSRLQQAHKRQRELEATPEVLEYGQILNSRGFGPSFGWCALHPLHAPCPKP